MSKNPQLPLKSSSSSSSRTTCCHRRRSCDSRRRRLRSQGSCCSGSRRRQAGSAWCCLHRPRRGHQAAQISPGSRHHPPLHPQQGPAQSSNGFGGPLATLLSPSTARKGEHMLFASFATFDSSLECALSYLYKTLASPYCFIIICRSAGDWEDTQHSSSPSTPSPMPTAAPQQSSPSQVGGCALTNPCLLEPLLCRH